MAKSARIAPTYDPAATMSEGMKQHLRTGSLSLLPHSDTAVEFENHTINSVYSVYDAYQRKMGLVISASYADEKKVTWFAVSNTGNVSIHLMTNRAEALQVLEVMYAAELLIGSGCMSKVKSPLLRD